MNKKEKYWFTVFDLTRENYDKNNDNFTVQIIFSGILLLFVIHCRLHNLRKWKYSLTFCELWITASELIVRTKKQKFNFCPLQILQRYFFTAKRLIFLWKKQNIVKNPFWNCRFSIFVSLNAFKIASMKEMSLPKQQ